MELTEIEKKYFYIIISNISTQNKEVFGGSQDLLKNSRITGVPGWLS